MDVYGQIEYEDLTYELKLMADACGIETVQKLLRHLGGMSFYLPKLSRLDNFIMKYLSQNKSKSLKEIAKDLKVSEQFLRMFRKRNSK